MFQTSLVHLQERFYKLYVQIWYVCGNKRTPSVSSCQYEVKADQALSVQTTNGLSDIG